MNEVHIDIARSLNSLNVCYCSFRKMLSIRPLFRNTRYEAVTILTSWNSVLLRKLTVA